MALILSIETATEVCSVALADNQTVLAERNSSGTNEHSALLTLFIEEIFRETGKQYRELDAIAVSMGPGSYTGLRIGVSTAKGLCYSLDKPLISVSTLKALAARAVSRHPALRGTSALLCPMIDARRMEVYSAIYNTRLDEFLAVDARIMDTEAFNEFRNQDLYLFGNGSDKCRNLFSGNERIQFLDGIDASAVSVAMLALEKFNREEFEDTAYFEPFYLKDFIAGKPRVKGLHS